jgi:hypothetical protein
LQEGCSHKTHAIQPDHPNESLDVRVKMYRTSGFFVISFLSTKLNHSMIANSAHAKQDRPAFIVVMVGDPLQWQHQRPFSNFGTN